MSEELDGYRDIPAVDREQQAIDLLESMGYKLIRPIRLRIGDVVVEGNSRRDRPLLVVAKDHRKDTESPFAAIAVTDDWDWSRDQAPGIDHLQWLYVDDIRNGVYEVLGHIDLSLAINGFPK